MTETAASPFRDHELFQGDDGQGQQYLLTVFSDGYRTLARRAYGEFTWGPPVALNEVREVTC